MSARSPLAVALCLLFACAGAAQEWPRFRGKNGSGVGAAVLPTTWTEKDYQWRVKLPGPGHSSPVLWSDRVFATSDTGKQLTVSCLDAATGRALWSREFAAGQPGGHKDNSLASATPATDARHVYVTWGTPKEVVLMALTHDGKDVWRRDLGPYRAGHGFGSSPIVHEELVMLPCEQDGKDCLVAVDAATGQDRWRINRKSRNTYATPCIFQPIDRRAELIAVSYEDGITSIDPANGKRNWELDVFDKRHDACAIASPVVHGDLILGAAGWLSVRYEVIAVKPSEPTGKPMPTYKVDRGAPLVPTPIADGKLLFLWGDGGIVTCCNARTGKPHWSERVDGSFYASPIIAGKYIYCPSREGDMVILAASAKFEEVGRAALREGTHATPAIAGGRMYIRTLTHLMCLEGSMKSGSLPSPRE